MKHTVTFFTFAALFALAPFLALAETEVKVDTGNGTFEMKAGPVEKEPEKVVIVEKQTVRPNGCSCQLDSGRPCRAVHHP